MHRPRTLIAEELSACIRCNECLVACPALGEPLLVETLNSETLNSETLGGLLSPAVARFARNCYQCGACVPVCPVGLHRDSMMLWLKMRLLSGDRLPAYETNPVLPRLRPVPATGYERTPPAPRQLRPHVHDRLSSAAMRTVDPGPTRQSPVPEQRRRRHA
jgi:ferredoxin